MLDVAAPAASRRWATTTSPSSAATADAGPAASADPPPGSTETPGAGKPQEPFTGKRHPAAAEQINSLPPNAQTAGSAHGGLVGAVPAWASDQLDSTRRMWNAFESWQRGILTGVGLLMGIGGVVFLLWDSFSSDATQQTKVVASDVLKDKDVRDQAFTATKELVRAVLRDNDAVELLVDVVQRLLATEGSRQSVSLFIKGIFEDVYVQEVTKHFVLQIVHDDWVREQLLVVARDLCLDLLKDAATKQAMTDFLVQTSADALADESLHRKGGSAIKSTVFHSIPGLAWTTGSGGSKPAPAEKEAPTAAAAAAKDSKGGSGATTNKAPAADASSATMAAASSSEKSPGAVAADAATSPFPMAEIKAAGMDIVAAVEAEGAIVKDHTGPATASGAAAAKTAGITGKPSA